MKDILSEIIGRVKTEQKSIAEAVTAGYNVNSFEDYQRLVGRHEGLMLTLDIINEILTEDEEDES
jgi:hypothetical protein